MRVTSLFFFYICECECRGGGGRGEGAAILVNFYYFLAEGHSDTRDGSNHHNTTFFEDAP